MKRLELVFTNLTVLYTTELLTRDTGVHFYALLQIHYSVPRNSKLFRLFNKIS